MKSKTNNMKVRRIGRKRKALPPHTWEAHPTANQGEVNKTLIIAVVTILAIVGLATLLFFSDTFVGEAVFMNTGINEGGIGFVLSSEQDSNVMNVDDSVTLPLIANFGQKEISGFNISIGYDYYNFEAVSCEGSESDVFAKLNEDFENYVVEQNVYCEDGKIHLYYTFIPPMDGLTKLTDEKVLAEITFNAINPGMEITFHIDEVYYSESVVDGSEVTTPGKSNVYLDIIPATVLCGDKIMQKCYPFNTDNNGLYCRAFGSNFQGFCMPNSCSAAMTTFMFDYVPKVKYIKDLYSNLDPPYHAVTLCTNQDACSSVEICFPASKLEGEKWPAEVSDQGVCVTGSKVTNLFTNCNGMETLCDIRELVYNEKCGLNQGDCNNNNSLCADGLTCTGTNDSYAAGISFCKGEVDELVCPPNQLFCIDESNVGRCNDDGLNYGPAEVCAGNKVCQDGACVTCTDEDKDLYCLESISIPNDKLGVKDCNDTNSTLFKWMKGFPDLDKDGFGSGLEIVPICTNGTLPETAADMAGDCDDTNATLFEWMDGYLDSDNDGFGTGAAIQYCTNGTLPETAADKAGDCNDGNDSITDCDGGECVAGACVADDDIVIGEVTCTVDSDCTTAGFYCIEEVCTNVTGKVILSEGDIADGTYTTNIKAIEGFADTPFNVFTILFGPNNETLVSESRVIDGLADTETITTSITFDDKVVSRKLVNVYDKLPHQGWTVHGELETTYE